MYNDPITEELHRRNVIMAKALQRIAAVNDEPANKHLAQTGSYAHFDEPGSVEIARQAMDDVMSNKPI